MIIYYMNFIRAVLNVVKSLTLCMKVHARIIIIIIINIFFVLTGLGIYPASPATEPRRRGPIFNLV